MFAGGFGGSVEPSSKNRRCYSLRLQKPSSPNRPVRDPSPMKCRSRGISPHAKTQYDWVISLCPWIVLLPSVKAVPRPLSSLTFQGSGVKAAPKVSVRCTELQVDTAPLNRILVERRASMPKHDTIASRRPPRRRWVKNLHGNESFARRFFAGLDHVRTIPTRGNIPYGPVVRQVNFDGSHSMLTRGGRRLTATREPVVFNLTDQLAALLEMNFSRE